MPEPPDKDEERQARSIALEQAYVHDAYFHIAPHFIEKKYRAWPRVRQFIQGLEPGSLLADVGCGPGRYLGVGGSEIFRLGLDTCFPLLEEARKRGNQQVVLGDNLQLPFRDESFDAALSVAVIHHFATRERRVQAIQELARILRIGGRVMITAWAMEQRHRKFESQDVLVPWNQPNKSSSEDPGSSAECEVTSTTTSDDDVLIYQSYNNRMSQEPEWSPALHRRSRFRDKRYNHGRSLDCPRSPSSSSDLSSPNETCYSFVRRALKKLSTSPYNYGSSRPYFYSSCRKPWLSDSLERDGGVVGENPTEEEEDQGWDNHQQPIELRHLDEPPPESHEEINKKNRSLSDLFGILPNFLRSRSKEEKSAVLVEIHKRISTASDPREYVLRSMGLKNGIVRSKSTVSCMSRFAELRLPEEEAESIVNKACKKDVALRQPERLEENDNKSEDKTEDAKDSILIIEKINSDGAEEDILATYYSMPELHKLEDSSQSSEGMSEIGDQGSKEVFQPIQCFLRPAVSFPFLHREDGSVKRSISVDNTSERMSGLLRGSKEGEDTNMFSRPRRYSASAAQGPLSKRAPRSALNSDTSVEDSSEDSFVSVVPRSSIQSDTSVDSEESIVSVIQRSPSEIDFRECLMRKEGLCHPPLSEDSERFKKRPPPSPAQLSVFWEERPNDLIGQTASALPYHNDHFFPSVSQLPGDNSCQAHNQELSALEIQMFSLRSLCEEKVSNIADPPGQRSDLNLLNEKSETDTPVDVLTVKTRSENSSIVNDLQSSPKENDEDCKSKQIVHSITETFSLTMGAEKHPFSLPMPEPEEAIDKNVNSSLNVLEKAVIVNKMVKNDDFSEEIFPNKNTGISAPNDSKFTDNAIISNELETVDDIISIESSNIKEEKSQICIDSFQASVPNSPEVTQTVNNERFLKNTEREENLSLANPVIDKGDEDITKELRRISLTVQEKPLTEKETPFEGNGNAKFNLPEESNFILSNSLNQIEVIESLSNALEVELPFFKEQKETVVSEIKEIPERVSTLLHLTNLQFDVDADNKKETGVPEIKEIPERVSTLLHLTNLQFDEDADNKKETAVPEIKAIPERVNTLLHLSNLQFDEATAIKRESGVPEMKEIPERVNNLLHLTNLHFDEDADNKKETGIPATKEKPARMDTLLHLTNLQSDEDADNKKETEVPEIKNIPEPVNTLLHLTNLQSNEDADNKKKTEVPENKEIPETVNTLLHLTHLQFAENTDNKEITNFCLPKDNDNLRVLDLISKNSEKLVDQSEHSPEGLSPTLSVSDFITSLIDQVCHAVQFPDATYLQEHKTDADSGRKIENSNVIVEPQFMSRDKELEESKPLSPACDFFHSDVTSPTKEKVEQIQRPQNLLGGKQIDQFRVTKMCNENRLRSIEENDLMPNILSTNLKPKNVSAESSEEGSMQQGKNNSATENIITQTTHDPNETRPVINNELSNVNNGRDNREQMKLNIPRPQYVRTSNGRAEIYKRGFSLEDRGTEKLIVQDNVRGRTCSEGALWVSDRLQYGRTRSDGTLSDDILLKELFDCVVVSGVDPEDPDEDEAFLADGSKEKTEKLAGDGFLSELKEDTARPVRAPPLGQQNPSLSLSTSQESLQGPEVGGSVTLHRYYHVFKEGELDHLIDTYVENLHIISSYYDHANWCVIAEKVQVWTI